MDTQLPVQREVSPLDRRILCPLPAVGNCTPEASQLVLVTPIITAAFFYLLQPI